MGNIMEYLSNQNDFSQLKNHLLNDPIIDYFNLKQNYYEKDKKSIYKEYILNESKKYYEKFYIKLKELSKLDIPLENNLNDTIDKIKNNIPLILNGTLLNKKDKTYVKC